MYKKLIEVEVKNCSECPNSHWEEDTNPMGGNGWLVCKQLGSKALMESHGKGIDPRCPLPDVKAEKVYERTANINDEVLVKITEEGEKMWDSYYAGLFAGTTIDKPTIERDEEGYTKMQLHEMAFMFGSELYGGKWISAKGNTQIPIEPTFKFIEKKKRNIISTNK